MCVWRGGGGGDSVQVHIGGLTRMLANGVSVLWYVSLLKGRPEKERILAARGRSRGRVLLRGWNNIKPTNPMYQIS